MTDKLRGNIDSVRGVEQIKNKLIMTGHSLLFLIIISVTIGVLIGVIHLYYTTRDGLKTDYICYLKAQFHSTKNTIHCTTDDNKTVIVNTHKINKSGVQNELYANIKVSAIYAGIAAIMVFFILYILAKKKGKSLMAEKYLRGTVRMDKEQLIDTLRKKEIEYNITIAGVPIPKEHETGHFLIAGATRQGKSVTIKDMMDQIRVKKQRAIVYDTNGEYIEKYYRPGRDFIFNPFDARMPRWTPTNEVSCIYDFGSIVKSLIPMPVRMNDPFWINAPRDLLESFMIRQRDEGTDSNTYIYEMLMNEDIDTLHTYLKGTPGAVYLNPNNQKTASSVLSALITYMRPFTYLPETGKNFSLKEYIRNQKITDSWLFIATKQEQIDNVRPLLSLWIDMIVQTILSLQPDRDRRIWMVLDEVATLQKIGIKDLVDKGGKYGVSTLLGLQTIAQLRNNYGRDETTSILSNINVWDIFKTPDSETAKYFADSIGKAENMETSEGVSMGASSMRDGVNMNQQRVERYVVSESEILNLERLQSFLKVPDYPVTKISINWKDRETIADGFLPRGDT